MITLRGAATPVLPPFQVPGQWGHLADGRSHPAGAPALRPRRDGAVPSTPACSVNCSLRPLRPSAREHADTSAGRRETRPARLRLPLQRGQQELSPMPPAPRAHARVHCARLTAEAALSKTATKGFPTKRPAFQTLPSALGTTSLPGSPHLPALRCLTIGRPSRHPDMAGHPGVLIWAHCPCHAPHFLWSMSPTRSR